MNQEQENGKQPAETSTDQTEDSKGNDLNFLIQNVEKEFYNSIAVPDTKDLVEKSKKIKSEIDELNSILPSLATIESFGKRYIENEILSREAMLRDLNKDHHNIVTQKQIRDRLMIHNAHYPRIDFKHFERTRDGLPQYIPISYAESCFAAKSGSHGIDFSASTLSKISEPYEKILLEFWQNEDNYARVQNLYVYLGGFLPMSVRHTVRHDKAFNSIFVITALEDCDEVGQKNRYYHEVPAGKNLLLVGYNKDYPDSLWLISQFSMLTYEEFLEDVEASKNTAEATATA